MVVVTLLLTLNIFHTYFWCCFCSLWTDKCLSRSFLRFKYHYRCLFNIQNSSRFYQSPKFSRYFTTSSYLTYFSWKKKKKSFSSHLAELGTGKFYPFSLKFFRQLVLREDTFGTAASLISYFLKGFIIKGAVIEIKKSMINDRLHVSEVSWKFRVLVIHSFPVIYPWNLLFS